MNETRRLIDYKIIQTDQCLCLDFFYKEILQAAQEGFEPFGNPLMNHNRLAQAMVKYAKKYGN